jgi:hypothetical protein
MNNLIVTLIISISCTNSFARSGGHSGSHSGNYYSHSGGMSHYTNGYTKKNGTYVAPHHASNPDGTKHNNYSSRGNSNPYTGKKGNKDPNKS